MELSFPTVYATVIPKKSKVFIISEDDKLSALPNTILQYIL